MNAHRAAVLGLFATALFACASEEKTAALDDSVNVNAVTTVAAPAAVKFGPAAKGAWPIGPASSTRTTGSPLNVPLVVKAMKKLKSEFYGKTDNFSPKRTPSWNNDEARQCLQACPEYYSDIVCHFYSWHPSYDRVSPNIRGCYTQIARGFYDSTIFPNASKSKGLTYPQAYDYCTYQPFDAVTNQANLIPGTQKPNAYDPKLIAKNKAAGNRVGVNAWVDENEEEAFKHVMFTWYDTKLFTLESQQEALNEFYGVRLSRPDYPKTANGDSADEKACRKAKRRTANDNRNGVPDGMECSTKKEYGAERHPNYAAIVKFMNGNDPSLQ
jgi:hypothetical protein